MSDRSATFPPVTINLRPPSLRPPSHAGSTLLVEYRQAVVEKLVERYDTVLL